MIGYLDCSTGVSGDKFLGALLGAGRKTGAFTQSHLIEALGDVLDGARLSVEEGDSRGIRAFRVEVEAQASPPARGLESIKGLIAEADLPERARVRAFAAFELLASAESKIHGCSPEEVHFHEVGALDSIVDIVGVCLGLDLLGVERLLATPVSVGGGTVDCSHGVLPVPAPATSALLEGVPTVAGYTVDSPGELTTPTGAALVRTCVDGFGPWPAMTLVVEGYGVGTRDIGVPNVCRLVLGKAPLKLELAREEVSVLETNVDHLSGEALGFSAEQLLQEGALDVWTTAAAMKKGRPAYVLSALVRLDDAEKFSERMIALTGTLGVRRFDIERYVAQRETKTLQTAFGEVALKFGPGDPRPEADDVARIARKRGVAFQDVQADLRDAVAEDD